MMKLKFNKPIISLIIVWFLIILGVCLRSYQADRYPVDNNDDGLHYTWAGISLIKNPLKPSTHSIFDVGNKALKWRSQYMDYIPRMRFGLKIVEPWQDHPPLGALIIGLPAYLLGFRQFELVPQLIVRYPAILASILTMYFTYLISKDLFNKKVARLALIFMATTPYFVIAHRQSFLENFLTPLFLIAFYDTLKYLKTNQKVDLIKVMIFSFFCGWIKVVGFAVPFMMAVWLWVKSKKKEAVRLGLIGITSILAYLGYAMMVSKEVFFQSLTNQGVRGAFASSFLNGLTVIEFYGNFRDGWYVLGFIMALVLLMSKKSKAFSWFFSAWLIVIFLTSGRLANSPWYRYPLIPFMSMALGFYAEKYLRKNSLFLALPFWLLGMTGFDLLKINLPVLLFRLGTVMFALIYGLKFMLNNKWVNK